MADSHRTDPSSALDATSGIDRDAKIEELLLVGLDHYFASHYEQAINVWTRALFLDRSHARARAYIERARSALAERQRQSEELLHSGVLAFQRGDGPEARRLLEAAIASGAPSDEALALLQRLDRLGAAAGSIRHERRPRAARTPASSGVASPSRWPARVSLPVSLPVSLLVIALLIAGVGYALTSRAAFLWDGLNGAADQPGPAAPGPVMHDSSLPLVRRGETALARARALAAGGHLRDALTALEAVRPTDFERADADRLQADIQHQLLSFGSPNRLP